MSNEINFKDKILLIVTSLSWIFLFVYISKSFINIAILNEIIGFFCGLSVSFANIFLYKKLKNYEKYKP